MGSIYMNDPANNQLVPVVKEMVGATGSTAGIGGLVPAPHAGDQNKVFYGDGNYKYPMNTWAGTCTTAANERIKEVSTDSAFALVAGAMVIVRYTNTNTYESSTGNPVQLDVNGTGARNIWYSTDDSGSGNTGVNVKIYGDSTRPIIYVYDGTYWVWVGCSLDSNTTYTPAGLGFGYGTCSTAASGTAKTVTLSGYSLVKNGIISVRFTYDVPASATLNVNSKGAKPIRYNNVAITDGVINAGDLATFIYTGSYYMLLAVDKATQPFTGASSSTNGTRGLVPPPQAGDENKVLRGDGTWGSIPIGEFDTTPTPDSPNPVTSNGIYQVTGSKNNLATTDKSSLVGAINEVNAAVAKAECLILTQNTVSSLPITISDSAIETDMVCIKAELSNAAAQTREWTVNTDTAGQATISGSISGTTNITLYMMKSR